MFAMARLVVSQQLQVLAADKGLIHVLGCNPDDANGQSVLSFIGPRSNMRLLQSQIHCMTGEKVQLILYDHAGCERRTIVSCSTYHRESCFVGCLLKLHLSEAVALQDAFSESPWARALVSANTADAPHVFHLANDAFSNRFSMTQSEILGQSLHSFCSRLRPMSGLSDDKGQSTEDSWLSMMSAALEGCITHDDGYSLRCHMQLRNYLHPRRGGAQRPHPPPPHHLRVCRCSCRSSG